MPIGTEKRSSVALSLNQSGLKLSSGPFVSCMTSKLLKNCYSILNIFFMTNNLWLIVLKTLELLGTNLASKNILSKDGINFIACISR